MLPKLSDFLDATMELRYFGEGGMLLPIALLTILVGAAGGVYPAFYLSRFQPAQVLKANKSTVGGAGLGPAPQRPRRRPVRGLDRPDHLHRHRLGADRYARTLDAGFRREGLIQVENLGRRQLYERSDTIAERMRRVPGVVSVGRSDIGIGTTNNNNTGVLVPGQTEPVNIGTYGIDPEFFETMGIQLVAGRLFDKNRPADRLDLPFPPNAESQRALVARGANVVINELAARRLGYRNPADAVGKLVQAGFVEDEYGVVPTRIIGVVRDSRFRSIHEPIDPIMFSWNVGGGGALLIRYDASDPQDVMHRLEQEWRRLAPDVPFDGVFSETKVAELYEDEAAQTKMFAGFALLAIIIACLGLFGLAAFTAERRTKEIGIRKVLGARIRDIVRLLAWQFSKPVIIANLIAWPVAWWRDERLAPTVRHPHRAGRRTLRGRRAARAGDRDRHHRQPRHQGRAGQPDPRAAL